jgi:hypothetical protein
MSLIVVASALPFRAATVPLVLVAANWPILVNLLAGYLLGAWFGAGWATSLTEEIDRIVAHYGERSGGFWVAVRAEEVVGMFGLESAPPDAMELRLCTLRPPHGTPGLGVQC